MNQKELINLYNQQKFIEFIVFHNNKNEKFIVQLKNISGSALSVLSSSAFLEANSNFLIICRDEEEALYFLSDLNVFLPESKILYFPSAFQKINKQEIREDKNNILDRSKTLMDLSKSSSPKIIVSWPEALLEKVVNEENFKDELLHIKTSDTFDLDFAIEFFNNYEFDRVGFVYEPGQFAIRGGIIDVFSYAAELPFRIELMDDKIESIRYFDPDTQLSVKKVSSVNILSNIENRSVETAYIPLFEYLNKNSIVFLAEKNYFKTGIANWYDELILSNPELNKRLLKPDSLLPLIENFSIVNYGSLKKQENIQEFEINTAPQPPFNNNFELLIKNLSENIEKGYKNLIFSDAPHQIERLYEIFEDIAPAKEVLFFPIYKAIHKGFIDHDLKIACYTEQEIFGRYHKVKSRKKFSEQKAITIKSLKELTNGDYVTHIDHGIGVYSGLEKIEVGGKMQEAVRLVYKGNDLLYVNIHSLYKISRYSGQDGKPARLHKLGSDTWEKLKLKTKQKVREIARDLIKLYAKRKASKGFAFSPDTYLQTELEASFIYEDTPDQAKAVEAVRKDMEKAVPMDRLVCGDVGFGKTEVAIRAAFKAVADNKQVAVLVPTTILAMQHFKTFSERLKDFPCKVDFVSRFKSGAVLKEALKFLEEGKTDIIIGTHKILGKDIKFKNLGLLIVDEEQKFGVTAKEKIRNLKVNIDTLTLTATPIPRTMQFSLMGARDLSIINTPPQNRQSVKTILDTFNEETIRDAITYELDRKGQVFIVHNRIKDIEQVVSFVRSVVPYAKIAVAHGQMENKKLEEIMVAFVDGFYDVLVSTSIIESGLDISNANTIIINQAQNFGLSDLYQMRGRVGRSNKKAYCYLLTPPLDSVSTDARKRIQAIMEFTELGSGFNIAMRDMDIRGAGNLLGAEQSGFIAEVGFDMFHKILDEAVRELKITEFKELYKDTESITDTIECQLDTDLEILIPDHYISNVNERLTLYNELSNIKNEKSLQIFTQNLQDRFGPLPESSQNLIKSIRLKWKAEKLEIIKLLLKNHNMRTYFTKKDEFYLSDKFGKILSFVKTYPNKCKLSEKNDQLVLLIKNVNDVDTALLTFQKIFEL